jgi:hypothetical protein
MLSNRFRFIPAFLVTLTLAAFAILVPAPKESRIYAQFVGSAQAPGFYTSATNAAPPTVIGNALAVTNPASNFLLLVQGGPVYCTSALAEIGQSTIQLQASNTYLIVVNCAQQTVYAKTAVTGPGSQGTNAINGPGFPAQILAPIAGVEVPIALVVCGNTNCGNTANGSITDQRPLSAFPGLGTPLETVAFANLVTTNATNGHIVYCDTCAVATAPCTGASTGALAIRVNGTWRCQ